MGTRCCAIFCFNRIRHDPDASIRERGPRPVPARGPGHAAGPHQGQGGEPSPMDQTTLILIVISIVLSLIALAVGFKAVKGEQRVKAAYRRFSQGRKEDVVTLLDAHIAEVEALRDEVAMMNQVQKR